MAKNNDQSSNTDAQLNNISSAVFGILQTMRENLAFQKAAERKKDFETDTKKRDTEKIRESERQGFFDELKKSWEDLKEAMTPKKLGIMGILGILAAALIAPITFAIGFLQGLFATIKGLSKWKGLKKLYSLVRTFFTRVIGGISRFFRFIAGRFRNSKAFQSVYKALSTFFTRVIGGISRFFRTIAGRFRNSKTLKFVQKIIGGVWKAIKGTFAFLKRVFDPLLDVGKSIGRLFGRMFTSGGGKLMKTISSSIGKFLRPLRAVGKVAGSLGRIAGKLALPITVIMGIIDFVKGFAKEKKNGSSFVKALGGGISELLKGLIGMPLDLLKNIVAWVAEKFGFRNAAQAMRDFSFSDLIENITDSIFGFMDRFVEGVMNFFSNVRDVFRQITTSVRHFIGRIISGITNFISSAVDTVITFFTPEDGLQGILSNVGELYTRLITIIPDTIRRGISAIAGFFGLERIQEFFENFSFAEMLRDLIRLPVNFVTNVIDRVKSFFQGDNEETENVSIISRIRDKMAEVLQNIRDAILGWIPTGEDIKNLVTGLLPGEDGGLGLFDGEGSLINSEGDGLFQRAGNAIGGVFNRSGDNAAAATANSRNPRASSNNVNASSHRTNVNSNNTNQTFISTPGASESTLDRVMTN